MGARSTLAATGHRAGRRAPVLRGCFDWGMDDAKQRRALDVERTRLANERTFLAWWRTGLAAVAAGFALGRLLPETIEGETGWPYILLGVLLTGAGIAATVYGTVRFRAVERSIVRGENPASSASALLVLAVAGTVAGMFALVFVAFSV
jgi:putative membrane protein